jgi:hypothetical protein
VTRPKAELLKACERVNKVLEEEAQRLELGTKKSLPRMDEARQYDKVAFSYWAQLEFQEFVRRQLDRHPTMNASILINSGARMLKISPATTKRYMAALRSGNGPFAGLGDIIMLNPNYIPTDQDDYWQENPSDPMEVE